MTDGLDLPTIIKARFLEAAHVDQLLPRRGTRPDGYGRAWGEYLPYSIDGKGRLVADRDLRGADAYAADRAAFWEEIRMKATTEQVTRHDECLRWTAEIVPVDAERRSLLAWALTSVRGRSFRGWCREEGISHMTAYRRVERAIGAISEEFRKNRQIPSLPGEEWVLHISPESGTYSGIVGESDGRSRDYWRATDAKPAPRPEMWERREVAEAKRREKLGAMA